MTKVKPSGLDIPEMPQQFKHLWHYFIDLKNAGEISFTAVKDFCSLMAVDLSPSDIWLIMEFDKTYRRVL